MLEKQVAVCLCVCVKKKGNTQAKVLTHQVVNYIPRIACLQALRKQLM